MENPAITRVYYRSDNAGCYHSSSIIQAAAEIGRCSGVSISRIDFSDPRAGNAHATAKQQHLKDTLKDFWMKVTMSTVPMSFLMLPYPMEEFLVS